MALAHSFTVLQFEGPAWHQALEAAHHIASTTIRKQKDERCYAILFLLCIQSGAFKVSSLLSKTFIEIAS